MNDQHTPGPWHVYRGRTLDNVWHQRRTVACYPQGDKEYGDMAIAYCDYHAPEQAEANARLIAAAPEMLRLLKRYRTETPLGNQPGMIASEVDDLLKMIA